MKYCPHPHSRRKVYILRPLKLCEFLRASFLLQRIPPQTTKRCLGAPEARSCKLSKFAASSAMLLELKNLLQKFTQLEWAQYSRDRPSPKRNVVKIRNFILQTPPSIHRIFLVALFTPRITFSWPYRNCAHFHLSL